MKLLANTVNSQKPCDTTSTVDTYALVDVQLEFLLRDALLDPLAEGGVSSRPAAALPVLDQAAALAVERRGRWPVVAVLLRAEAVHCARVSRSSCENRNDEAIAGRAGAGLGERVC